ncbi:palmitoyltransferase ZDHHC6-like [Centruroides sculpturatus]|uniref:palmitoyltransferase ZDHHC6-like n=1 Tax=Centruroides sculpturatus TaxID=218467 RepID=UPI000C6CA7E0|nr:palmitoyltransferase ZDHHC6-like [Centruroides sculpturatus]
MQTDSISSKNVLRRLFHWGPIFALFIIKSILLTTLYVTSMWFPPFTTVAGTLNHFIFLGWVGATLYNFFCAMIVGPGYIPYGWKPKNPDDVQYLQYCSLCDGYKAPRVHHCRKCKRCVMKMDHHCPWINNCCGHRNHANFTWFLFCAVCGSIQSTVLLITAIYRAFHLNWYLYHGDRDHIVYLSLYTLIFTVFSLGLAIGVIIAVGGLFVVQLKSIWRNKTSIEDWIVTKALSRPREEGDVFIYPYDLGCWKNLLQVFWNPLGDGINWPIRDDCFEYTLTVEQLYQKEDKRARTRQYTVVQPYKGTWFPISKGIRTCCSIPYSDEPRIPLEIGDQVSVTRWRKHWLYGEKIPLTESSPKLRGWFPRVCAIEFTSTDCEIEKIQKKFQ